MRKSISFLLNLIFITTIADRVQAQLKPVVLDTKLRYEFTSLKEQIKADSNSMVLKKHSLEDLNETFKNSQDSDVVRMIKKTKAEKDYYANRYKQESDSMKTIEESIKKIIKNAQGRPVLYRQNDGDASDTYTIETFTIENGHVYVVAKKEKFKEDEKH